MEKEKKHTQCNCGNPVTVTLKYGDGSKENCCVDCYRAKTQLRKSVCIGAHKSCPDTCISKYPHSCKDDGCFTKKATRCATPGAKYQFDTVKCVSVGVRTWPPMYYDHPDTYWQKDIDWNDIRAGIDHVNEWLLFMKSNITEEWTEDELNSLWSVINSGIILTCYCDDYNGFDCGCSRASELKEVALSSIEALRAKSYDN